MSATDHKAEAEMLYGGEYGDVANHLGFETCDAQHLLNMFGAIAQATLYLAEQQKRTADELHVANLIAVANAEANIFSPLSEGSPFTPVFVAIREGLGLE